MVIKALYPVYENTFLVNIVLTSIALTMAKTSETVGIFQMSLQILDNPNS